MMCGSRLISGRMKSKLTGLGRSPAPGDDTKDAKDMVSSAAGVVSCGLNDDSPGINDSFTISFLGPEEIALACFSPKLMFDLSILLADFIKVPSSASIELSSSLMRFLVRVSNFFLINSGLKQFGRDSGRAISFLRRTTKCMAVRNSSKLRHPSLDTSESCQMVLSSEIGRRDFSKNSLAWVPGINPTGFDCMLKNCVV